MRQKQKKDDSDFEILFYEGIVAKKPDFIEALCALGDLYTKKGYFKKGLEVDLKLVKLRPHDPVVLYNLACSYSLLNQISKSLSTIKLAIKYGYDDLDHLKEDRDLINLRNDARFQRFFLKVKTKRK